MLQNIFKSGAPLFQEILSVELPTVHPTLNFNPYDDCVGIDKKIKVRRKENHGSTIADVGYVLLHRTSKERVLIKRTYQNMYGRSLLDDIDDITEHSSGYMRNLIEALLADENEFYANEIHSALNGISFDKAIIAELCMMTDDDMGKVQFKYQEVYGRNIEDDMTPENLKSVLEAFSGYERQELMNIDPEYGADTKPIASIKDCLMTILMYSLKSSEYFATSLHTAMIGTPDHKSLTRIIVMRSEVDMGNIKTAFLMKYGYTLKSRIEAMAKDWMIDKNYIYGLLTLIGEAPTWPVTNQMDHEMMSVTKEPLTQMSY